MKTKGNNNEKPKEKTKVKFPRLIRRLCGLSKKSYFFGKDKVKKSLRLELILVFGICLLLAFISSNLLGSLLNSDKRNGWIDYRAGAEQIANEAANFAGTFQERKMSIKDDIKINEIIQQQNSQQRNKKLLICDLDGKVLYASGNVSEKQVDIFNLIKNISDRSKGIYYTNSGQRMSVDENTECESIYPIDFSDGKGYIVVKGIPSGTIVYDNNSNNNFFAVLFGFAVFIISFYYITSRKMQYIETVSTGLLEISKGNLDYKIKKKGEDELAYVAENINHMTEELKNKIEKEREADKIKNELITNVSHDLRTPLTSIKGYLGLIKYKKYEDKAQLDEYINIAYNKSEKLEVLINDLFEYTKLSNKALNMKKENIIINDLLQQLTEELVPICEENSVTIEKNFNKVKANVFVDPNKMVRVFENLLMNAIRYSAKPGSIAVILSITGEYVYISVSNKCDGISKEDINKLFERFYRTEKSRSSETGGSGLGLAIAKSIVELHGGTIQVEYNEPDICFTVKLIKNS